MPVKQSETSLTTDEYGKLLAATTGFQNQVIIYRQNPNFDTEMPAVAHTITIPFSADAGAGVLRAYNSSGSVSVEYFNGSTWASAILLTSSGKSGIAPKVVAVATGWDVYLIKSDNKIYVYHSTDAASWDGGTQWSTVTVAGATFMSFADGGIPLVYVFLSDSGGHIAAISPTVSYDTGIYWANGVTDFDAIDFQGSDDDTTGIHSYTKLRHCIVMACQTPALSTYTTDLSGSPIAAPVLTGGLVSFVIHPPNEGRPIQVSRTYPVDVYDRGLTFQNRATSRLSSTSSVFNPTNNRDTIWLTSAGSDGDVININDQAYYYDAVFYYSSRDGVHWSQNKIIPNSQIDFNHLPTVLLKVGTFLYMVCVSRIWRSKGCYEFYNPHADLTLDISRRIQSYSSSIADARQSNIVLDNTDNKLWQSFLGQPGVFTVIAKIGLEGHAKVQVSTEEVDSIQPHQERPQEQVRITCRDRTSWITDRIQSAQAEYWDSQVAGLDQFRNVNGANDTGLAHSDVVKGSFTTSIKPFTLSLQDNYQEGISFNTFKSNIVDGREMTIFTLPNPTGHGGSSASDSPTYAGLVFRAQDKDNMWIVRYNWWTNVIELLERRAGVDTIKVSHAPTTEFLASAHNVLPAGLMVDVRGGRVRVYESTSYFGPYSAHYKPSFAYYIAKGTDPAPTFLQGYFGEIACGFSDQVSTDSTTPVDPPVPPDGTGGGDYGTPDTGFHPTRYYLYSSSGRVLRGAGSVGSPAYTDISPSPTVKATLASGLTSPEFCPDMIFNPFHLHEAILLGPHNMLRGTNMDATPSYTNLGIHPPSGYYWGGNTGIGGFAGRQGQIVFNINVEGYFGWLEIPYNPSDYCQYAYTHDNFATVQRTNLGLYPSYGSLITVTLGQHASAWTNIPVFVSASGYNQRKFSTDGGQTFAYNTTSHADPDGDLRQGGLTNLPYTLGHGVANTSNTGLLDFLGVSPRYYYFIDIDNDAVIIPGMACDSPYSINTLTVDGNYVVLMDPYKFIVSSDGGANWGVSNHPNFRNEWAVCGWPTNPNFFIAWGNTVSVTFDQGVTWTNIDIPGGLAGGEFYVKCQADLTEHYDVGGPVH